MKDEAEQAFKVSQKAQCEVEDALLKSQHANGRAENASNKADAAETDARSAEKLSKQSEKEAASSLELADVAQIETAAQRRALRSIHINPDLGGSLPSGYGGGSSSFGTAKTFHVSFLPSQQRHTSVGCRSS